MKHTITIIAALTFLGLGSSTAFAGEAVSIGLHLGVPYYQTPPPYYADSDDALWMETPVEIIYIDGAPHPMHMWHGHWYDEAWAKPGHERRHHENTNVRYRNDRDDNIHGGRRW